MRSFLHLSKKKKKITADNKHGQARRKNLRHSASICGKKGGLI